MRRGHEHCETPLRLRRHVTNSISCAQCGEHLYDVSNNCVLTKDGHTVPKPPVTLQVGNLRYVLCGKACAVMQLQETSEELMKVSWYPLW